MQRTATLREQNNQLMTAAGAIIGLMEGDLGAASQEIRGLLGYVSGLLQLHLRTEDRAVYPALLGHRDTNVNVVGRKYVREMGGLKTSFESYLERWPSPDSIRADAPAFRHDTEEVMRTLGQRIRSENDLFNLFDALN